jgi:hypothetical protein
LAAFTLTLHFRLGLVLWGNETDGGETRESCFLAANPVGAAALRPHVEVVPNGEAMLYITDD